jgi:hypothetical protein
MSDSTEEILITKIESLSPNKVNEEIILIITSKSENKFSNNKTRYNTLLRDESGEFISCQTYNDDLFKNNELNDVVVLNKFIAIITVDDKYFLPLNKKGFKLETTSVSSIEILSKKNGSVQELLIENIDMLANSDKDSVKLFKNIRAIVLNKTISHPNNKVLVKVELISESYNYGIHLILWSNDVVLDENYLYTFKFITIDKYNNGWQLAFNHFTKHEREKKFNVNKINMENNFIHLTRNIDKLTLYSTYDMFYMHSKGYLVCKILDVNKKRENFFQLKVCVNLDDRQKILYISTFDRCNLYPFIAYNDKEVDKKMFSLIGLEFLNNFQLINNF